MARRPTATGREEIAVGAEVRLVPLLTLLLMTQVASTLGQPVKGEGPAVSTERQGGLQVVAFHSLEGTVRVFLPAELAEGERVSGTVVAEPTGENPRQRARRGESLAGRSLVLAGVAAAVGAGRWSGTLPAGQTTPLELVDRSGRLVGRQSLALAPSAAAPVSFSLPPLGQAVRPLLVAGPFDGDLDTTAAVVGGALVRVLAESAHQAVLVAPAAPLGQNDLVLREGDAVVRSPFRNLKVDLEVGKRELAPGETTDLQIIVSGLEQLDEPVSLGLRNQTPEVIEQQGGAHQRWTIEPAEVRNDAAAATHQLLGLMVGNFTVTADVLLPDPCACTCTASITGPATIFRHWAPERIPPAHRRPYLEAARYQAGARFACTGTGRPPYSDQQCTYGWSLPEGWSSAQMLAGGNTLSLFAPPASLLGTLERTGSATFALGVAATCPYRCGAIDAQGDHTVARSCACAATKQVTLVACRDEAEARRSADECASLRAELERAAAAAQAATLRAASARRDFEFGVQVHGRMIGVVCEGLEAASDQCDWAITLERIKLGLTAAGAVAGGVAGALEGALARDLHLALQELLVVLGAKMYSDLDTGQCEAAVVELQQQLIEYKIKACEHARPFGDSYSALGRAVDALRRALDRARRYDGCVPCDLVAAIARAEGVLREAERELAALAAVAQRYRPWLDFCAHQGGYTAGPQGNAGDICSQAPPVP